MSLCEIDTLADSYITKREIQGQDSMYIAYTQALLLSTAMWSPKDLPKTCPEFRIRPLTDEEQEEIIMKELSISNYSMRSLIEENTEDSVKAKATEMLNSFDTIEDMGYTMGGEIDG